MKSSNNLNKQKNSKMVTSVDVAKLAGVSQSSVSRVFNPSSSREVKSDIRERVINAANELGYKPNFVARSMISGKTNIIGVVVGDGIGPFYNKIITTFISKIQMLGKQCLIFKVDKEENIDSLIERVLQFQVDGIIITSPAISREMVDTCIENETPVVLFNRFVPGFNISSVYCDNIQGGSLAAEYLCENGKKNIAHVGYEKGLNNEVERKMGFYAKLRENNIYEIIEETAEYTYESGYEAGKRLLSLKKPIDAIFCTSDLIAMGIIDAARYEFGISIPDELSIVGYDNISMSNWAAYNLSTIEQPIDKLIDETIDVLTLLMKNEKLAPITRMIKMRLVERNSVSKTK